jgi:V/A-type H+-transporting ATPase subunit F
LKKIKFITPPDVEYGFALTGVTQHTCAPEQAEQLLRKIMAEPDSGVVLIDERLITAIDEEKFKEMERRWFGILIILPAPETVKGEPLEDYALRMIRKAIGYHVRLKV